MLPNKKADRTCCICKKIFCCVECRIRHERRKHSDSELKCALCMYGKLPLQHFEDKEHFCHIVANHLPLQCCLCGDNFPDTKHLETFGPCSWWQTRYHLSLIPVRKKSFLGTPSPASGCIDKTKEQSAIDGDYNENFENLTSPPELQRNTSTPMHVGFVSQGSYEFKIPNVQNFSLKTLKITSPTESPAESSGNSDAESDFVSFSPRDLQTSEFTPFRVAPIIRKDVPFMRKNSERTLAVMKEQDEQDLPKYCSSEGVTYTKIERVDIQQANLSDDMELTGVEGGILSDSKDIQLYDKSERRSESIKRVRFSDQHSETNGQRQSTGSVTGFNLTENDEYYEARETLFETKEHFESLSDQISNNSDVRVRRENEKNMEKENHNPDGARSTADQQPSSMQSSSRVVMMLVVENKSGFTTSDLKPLIDSGLKQLEQHSSNTVSAASSSCLSNYADATASGSSRKSVTSVDTYFSISSSVNCYSTPDSSGPTRQEACSTMAKAETAGRTSSGIFSAVAHAFRFALRNFSGTRGKDVASEQPPQREEPTSRLSPDQLDARSVATSVLSRPGKRPRDLVESPQGISRPIDATHATHDVISPVAKRQRGWYKIKGREPIARMRSSRITSPRGVSSETQVFSQGSLSVGDTVLPIPSRAHQSTQTE